MDRAASTAWLIGARERLRRSNPWVVDTVIAALVMSYAIGALYAVDQGNHHTYKHPGALAIALVVAGTAPYALRRRAPLAPLLAATLAVLILTSADYQVSGLVIGLLVATYAVGAYASQRERAFGLVWIGAALVVARFVPHGLDNGGLALNAALFGVAYLFGSTIRNRRLYTQQLEERAQLLEREREEESMRLVADERLRIAQELHDVVAHSMGVIAVQAGVGAHVIDTNPADAKDALEHIAATSRASLAEIRRILGALRGDEGAAYQPAPGLDDLDRLAHDVQTAGVPVDVEVSGDRRALPHGVDLTAYRIVQEALTNVLKHAGPARARVRVTYETGTLQLEVTDDGRGVNGRATDGGHGLLGMRERVAVYGGSLTCGPRPGGGYRVVATLPYDEQVSSA